jgi:hypothetical protein
MLAIADLLTRVPGKAKESMGRQSVPDRYSRMTRGLPSSLQNTNWPWEIVRKRWAARRSRFSVKAHRNPRGSREIADWSRQHARRLGNLWEDQPDQSDIRGESVSTASVQYLTGSTTIAKQTPYKALDLDPNPNNALMLLAKLEAGGNRNQA